MSAPLVYAQTLPTHEEIFTALYGSHYNPATGLLTWHCPQEATEAPDGCPASGDATAVVNLLQVSLQEIDSSWKAFVVASATARDAEGQLSDCHACEPSVSIGVLTYRGNQWQVESRNDGRYQFGSWGKPATPELVKIGPKLYGFMFTLDAMGGGYAETSVELLAPEGKTVHDIWSNVLDEDNRGAYNPTLTIGMRQRIHVDAAYCFLSGVENGHYFLQVVSRGYGLKGSRNSTSTYRFFNGQYRQIGRHLPRPVKGKNQPPGR